MRAHVPAYTALAPPGLSEPFSPARGQSAPQKQVHEKDRCGHPPFEIRARMASTPTLADHPRADCWHVRAARPPARGVPPRPHLATTRARIAFTPARSDHPRADFLHACALRPTARGLLPRLIFLTARARILSNNLMRVELGGSNYGRRKLDTGIV